MTGVSVNPARSIVVAATLLAIPAAALAQYPPALPEDAGENSGQDPTRPVTRVDLRLKYQNNPAGFEDGVLTLRADKPFALSGG